ncbi:MAG: ribosome biogenesis GTPase Der [Desulfobulbaceae bacterium]|nr:ribosome biogenesis GTPase Der [Desulfobulbaceae bacterium]
MSVNNIAMVALIGRPNVGKSTFFNRLTRSRDAIVDPTPGVTRDRHYARLTWNDKPYMLVDTGGIDDDGELMTQHIRKQALQAIEEADIIIFLMDGRQSLTPGDYEIATLLRRTDKKVFFVVNKIDGPEQEINLLSPFYELGVEKLWPLSAEHSYGFNDLLNELSDQLPDDDTTLDLPLNTIRLAFLGRPNVGKSSMINQIIGQERMVVSDISGTTRDSVDSLLTRDDYNYLLIDTAGIRRKGKTTDKLEKFSILKSLGSLTRCEIAVVLIDASEGITEQDTTVIGYTQDHGRACIILLNKWDLIKGDVKRQKQLLEELAMATKFIAFAPVIKVSALTGSGIKRLFPTIGAVHRQFNQRFSTSKINQILRDAVERHEPSMHKGRRLKLYYTAQVKTAPPTFVVITNAPKGIHFSYERYLINKFRDGLGLDRTPIQMIFKERSQRKTKDQLFDSRSKDNKRKPKKKH